MPNETKDVHLSLRISTALKNDLQSIADDTHRTLNNATELIIRKGIAAFRADNILVDTRPVAEELAKELKETPRPLTAKDLINEIKNLPPTTAKGLLDEMRRAGGLQNITNKKAVTSASKKKDKKTA